LPFGSRPPKSSKTRFPNPRVTDSPLLNFADPQAGKRSGKQINPKYCGFFRVLSRLSRRPVHHGPAFAAKGFATAE